MSKDQMQDVFPIQFEYKEGEQPTSEKKTAVIKHTDSAFSGITQAVGDPWDYQSHTIGSLSLEKLGQPSLARMIGPSDWLSPMGGCWNEDRSSAINVILKAYKNQWVLGYPLVKVSTPLEESSSISSTITPLVWGTDITVNGSHGGVLTNLKTDLADVVLDGDFHIDYYKGIITAYRGRNLDIYLHISNINMFGAGTPWGTHNVIPTWETTVELCNVAKVTDFGQQTRYTLTLPAVSDTQRVGSSTLYAGKKSYSSSDYDSSWSIGSSGHSSQYRLPAALTTAGLSAGTAIPEGYILLWDGGRVVPLVDFVYKDENSLTLETPQDWLSEGDNYRILISGTSISEAVGYLMETSRYGVGNGLSETPSVSYSQPISHENLENRFSGNLTSTYFNEDRLKFRESSYPTNCHPQYLHRYGYMANDEDGNDSNAMRGDLYLLASDLGMDTYSSSYKISFGNHTSNYIGWEGARDDTSGSGASGVAANRFGFNLSDTGAQPSADDTNDFGAMAVSLQQGAPLYVRGLSGTDFTTPDYSGAVLGMDLGHRSEMNYIKMMAADRDGTLDVSNKPARTGQADFNAVLDITPSLSNRLSSQQIREWRFRAVPNVENSTNFLADSLGATELVTEFYRYFTSPGMVGADFFNVYSNAIFFSDTGDGKTTSFTDNAINWLNLDIDRPSGLYFRPDSTNPNFLFTLHESGTSRNVFSFGYSTGFAYWGIGDIVLSTEEDVHIRTDSSTGIINIHTTALPPTPLSYGDIYIDSASSLYTSAATHILMAASAGNNTIQASGVVWGYGETNIWLSAGPLANLPTHDTTNSYNAVLKADKTTGVIQLLTTDVGDNITLDPGDVLIKTPSTSGVMITTDDAPYYSIGSGEISINSSSDIQLGADAQIEIRATGGLYFPTLGSPGTGTDLVLTGSNEVIEKSSSIKNKENVKEIEDVSWLLDLKAKQFNFKGQPDIPQYGFIAEEVNDINSDVVFFDINKEPKSLSYDSIFSALVKLVQEQQKKIEELENKIG